MRQIVADSKTDDVEFAGTDGDTGSPAMQFQTNICPKRQADVFALGAFEAKLSALDAGELLEGTMVDFDQPGAIKLY